MAEVVLMPKLSDTMAEGVVAKWHKNVGDKVKSGDLLAEIETDKATMEFESFQEGILLYKGVEEGQAAPVDSILAILGHEGEDVSRLIEEYSQEAKGSDKTTSEKDTSVEVGAYATPAHVSGEIYTVADTSEGRIKASPLAKKLAKDKGIDLTTIPGSGEGGRIIKRDVEQFKGAVPEISPDSKVSTKAGLEYTDVPLSQMRKTIARRLSESKFSAPHFYLTIDIDAERLVVARDYVNKIGDIKISFNDIIIKAVALALQKNPKVNASWMGDKIRYHHYVHIGVAVAVDDGLVVPIIRHAEQSSISEISKMVKDFAQRAKEKKLQPQELEGNTFTISNLGMFGIESFTAIINPPDSCILAVGALREEPVVKNNQIVVGKRMKMTLSCDHRAVDGATGSLFLQTVKQYLEEPLFMLM